MKSLMISMAAALTAAIAFVGCKPTESNYRKAYETAMAGRQDQEDSTVYMNIRRELKESFLIDDNDSLPMKSQYVMITPDGGGIREYIKKYCIVAGQFKQLFNAKSMRERLIEQGYPGAFVVQTREPYYFVIAASYTSSAEAAAMLRQLQSDQQLRLLPPAPFILLPANCDKTSPAP